MLFCLLFIHCDCEVVFPPLLLDEPSVLHKSTRHIHHDHEYSPQNKNHKKYFGSPPTTSSTIIIRGLLDDYCFSDSDCTLTYSVCGQRTRRCMCKNGSSRSSDGKACLLNNEISKYLRSRILQKKIFILLT